MFTNLCIEISKENRKLMNKDCIDFCRFWKFNNTTQQQQQQNATRLFLSNFPRILVLLWKICPPPPPCFCMFFYFGTLGFWDFFFWGWKLSDFHHLRKAVGAEVRERHPSHGLYVKGDVWRWRRWGGGVRWCRRDLFVQCGKSVKGQMLSGDGDENAAAAAVAFPLSGCDLIGIDFSLSSGKFKTEDGWLDSEEEAEEAEELLLDAASSWDDTGFSFPFEANENLWTIFHPQMHFHLIIYAASVNHWTIWWFFNHFSNDFSSYRISWGISDGME